MRSAVRKMSFAILVLVASSILAVLVTILAALSGAQAEVSAVESNVFGQTTKYGVGWNPFSVTVGNFNGGPRDLAVANQLDDTVSILLGRGDGTFRHTTAPKVGLSPTPAEPVGGRPMVIAVGDFNEEGRQDLATANAGSGEKAVSILLGKGDGTFAPATHVRLFSNSWPFSIASGDFNRDGHVDLATANLGTVTVGVLLGRGDGTFSRQPDLPVPFNNGNLVEVEVADFNGDARQDLTVSDHYFNDVLIFLGRGNGTFGEGRRFDVGIRPTNIAVGDFNEDGRKDLATANDVQYTEQVSLLFGKGDGTFQPVRFVQLDSEVAQGNPQAIALTVGDFNGDCHSDLATADGGTGDMPSIAVLLGDGSGRFEHVQSFEAGQAPYLLAAGRFNRDRASDLAIPNANDFPGTVSVALSTGAVGCT